MLGLALIIASLGIFGLGTALLLSDARTAQDSGPRARATVLRVEHGRRGEPTFARVRFPVGDEQVEGDVDLIATRLDPEPGDVFEVAYLREDPAFTVMAAEVSMIEQVLFQGAFGLALAGLGTYGGVRLIRAGRSR